MRKKLLNIVIISTVVFATFRTVQAQTVSNFDSLSLTVGSYWNGSSSPLGTSFSDGNAIFPNYYDTSYGGFWSKGWAYSNMEDSTTTGFMNLYSAVTASGYNGSPNYAVGQNGAIIKLNAAAAGKEVSGFYITNGTYAALSMRDGDGFAKKFGGASGDEPDWFKLTIKKWLGGVMADDSVDFYLADYRFVNNTQDYIVNTWQWVNLISLGNVDSLLFTLSSSDAGAFGMNTPSFFCIDNFTTVDIPSAVDETKNNNIVSIFPNPASNVLNLNLGNFNQQPRLVRIHNVTGQLVYKENTYSSSLQINISQFPAGMYNITVTGNDSFSNQSFIKLR